MSVCKGDQRLQCLSSSQFTTSHKCNFHGWHMTYIPLYIN